jgi:hypothetical protein
MGIKVCGCRVEVYVDVGPCMCAGYYAFARQFVSRGRQLCYKFFSG